MATDRYIVKGKDTSFLPFSAPTDGFRFALPLCVNLRKRLCFYEPFSTSMIIETVPYLVP